MPKNTNISEKNAQKGLTGDQDRVESMPVKVASVSKPSLQKVDVDPDELFRSAGRGPRAFDWEALISSMEVDTVYSLRSGFKSDGTGNVMVSRLNKIAREMGLTPHKDVRFAYKAADKTLYGVRFTKASVE